MLKFCEEANAGRAGLADGVPNAAGTGEKDVRDRQSEKLHTIVRKTMAHTPNGYIDLNEILSVASIHRY